MVSLFERAALAMYGNGYSLLPIGAGTKSPGIYRGLSADGTKGPWFGLSDWQSFCIECAPEAKTASWGRMADRLGGGIGLACGFGGVVAVDIDDDALIEPLIAVLPPILVAKKGRTCSRVPKTIGKLRHMYEPDLYIDTLTLEPRNFR